MKIHLLTTFLILMSFTACKTQEDIRREKTVENLNEQVVETQKSNANASTRFSTLEEQIAKLTGQLEESNHNKQRELNEAAILKDRVVKLEESNNKQTEYIRQLNEKLLDQSKYIEQVIKSLEALSEQKEKSSVKKKVAKEKSEDEAPTLKNALALYREKDYDASKEMFQALLDAKKPKKKEKEAAYNFLGMIEFREKNYEEAKILFSKLFSENPDSIYGASALLNLAKTFLQLKSKEEASQSLDELIARFPKSKEAIDGAKLKAKL